MPAWDPQFATRSPMFAPLRGVADALGGGGLPTPQDLNRLAAAHGVMSGGGQPLRFEPLLQKAAPAAADYELYIHDAGVAPLRTANWHDLFNALVWLAFPRTKAVLNRVHVLQLRSQAASTAGGRGRRRDALTLLDESGVLVVSSDAMVLARLRGFEWKRLFWDERETLMRSTRFLLFGHGLYEKALAPYLGMTGHALLLACADPVDDANAPAQLARDDALAARAVETLLVSPRDLTPLPLLGVPGWWVGNQDAAFYDNAAYFRPRRMRAAL